MITAQIEDLFAHKIGKNGISQETEHEFVQKRIQVAEQIAQNIKDGQYGYVNSLAGSLSKIKTYLKDNSWIKTMVVIGIGGSDLGGRAIRQALAKETKTQKPHIDVLFHGDSPDPNDIDWLLDRITFSSTVFNIVSKSGGTMETMLQYAYLKELMQKKKPKTWRSHFVFTTDDDSGALVEEAEVTEIKRFVIPDEVGGRYSVLSAAGLLPAAAMGLDIDQMVSGAAYAISRYLEHPVNSVPVLIAWTQYLLYTQGLKTAVLMPYSSRLNEFARWYRQLWAESLGKKGSGILPIQARGPADQHSQLQFYTDGELLGSIWFMRLENHGSKKSIENTDVPGLEYLIGKDFGHILNVEQQATAISLTKAGRPNATVVIDELTEFSLGELFMTFELAVTVLGEFLDVNVFDQPGVEDSKRITSHLLGREGYEILD